MGGLVQPDSPLNLTLEQGLAQDLIDTHTRHSLSELESALLLVETTTFVDDQRQNMLPVATAMEMGLFREEVGLRILELQINTGGLRDSTGKIISLEQAEDMKLLSPRVLTKLQSRLQHKELIDPNTAEKCYLYELQQRSVLNEDSGLLLFPVKQQPGGTVCLRSGRKVGIFRAVQEGLIDRKVTVRLLEAQLFAGGITDPRSGHRLTVDEAVRHGLMDQDLACAMLARQLQNGGILDPFSGERLDLEESIRRDLLSPRLALLVLESLWAFMGLLWPESGELLPIAEALQQGMISGELARNILTHRHAIGALYNPETLQVLPLNRAAGEAFELSVVSFLKETYIPDVIPNMNQSGTPSLNRLSWGSTSSSTPPSSPSSSSCPTGLVFDATPIDGMDPEEQAQHKLLFHLMTHSYVDVHSGKRLVLLNSELMELIKAAELVVGGSLNESQVESLSNLSTDKQLKMQIMTEFSLTDKGVIDEQLAVKEDSSSVVTPSKDFEISGKGSLTERSDEENDEKYLQKPSLIVESDSDSAAKGDRGVDKDAVVKPIKKEILNLEIASAKVTGKLAKSESKCSDNGDEETITTTVDRKTVTVSSKAKEDNEEKTEKTNEDVHLTQFEEMEDSESERVKQKLPVTETNLKNDEPQADIRESTVEKEGEDAHLARLVQELQQGGLMTEDGEKLLPDEAVAQGVLPGHTAVKLMAQAGLFGGFLDAGSGESLSMEDVMQEGLLDEDLMWSVLKSDKTLAGVVNIAEKQIYGVKEAAQAGLIDSNTAARLIEAQVASGGIVDLRREKKVSVTLATNLGLIDEDQREELVALEKAYKGKVTDLATSLKKASLQLQMEGVIDPESKSPVPLEQAIQKGLIRSEEAYQVLAKQVAEGGIIHHASGIRLSVTDAVDRGLVDRSVAPGLEELEWVYQGKASPSSNPEATILQASTGAILDPDSGRKLTLSKAVSKGLLDENIANEAMASPTVTKGALDPQTACIVPYSELVRQGKIDIETGKRFLEVKPFKGIENEQTKDLLTLSEAVASKQVDPVPALRLLQSQADSGGIIDITYGERLSLSEAYNRGLVGDNMVKVIATNQILKGGLVDPNTGQRVSSLSDATAEGLISRDIASEIQQEVASMAIEGDEDSSASAASSNGTYSPTNTLLVSSPGSSAKSSDANTEEFLTSQFPKEGLAVTQGFGKTLTETKAAVLSDQSLFYDSTTEMGKIEVPLSMEEKSLFQPDQSMDLLCNFATKVEKKIQQAIKEIIPQKDPNKLDNLPKYEPRKTDNKQNQNIISDSVEESTVPVYDTDKDSKEINRNGVLILKPDDETVRVQEEESSPSGESTSVVHHVQKGKTQTSFPAAEIRDDRDSKDNIELPELSEEKCRKSDVVAQRDDGNGKEVGIEKPFKIEIKSSTDTEQSDKVLPSQSTETESKSKKKRKNKKKGKGKETESELQPPPIEHPSKMYQGDAEIEGQPEATDAITVELESQDKYKKSQRHGQANSCSLPSGGNEAKTEAKSDLVEEEKEVNVDTLKGTRQMALSKDVEKHDKKSEMENEEQKKKKEKDEEKALVSQQPEQPENIQEVKKRKYQELPPKSTLPDEEKAVLILKAKESILKKVFEKGVSEKQAAEELQALRKEVVKKEIQDPTAEDIKAQTLPANADGTESHNVKDKTVKTLNVSPKQTEEEMSVKEDKIKLTKVKEGISVEKPSVQVDVEAKPLKASSNNGQDERSKKDLQKDVKTAPSVQPKETQQSKQSKKSKKSKSLKVTDKAEPHTETLPTDKKVDSDVTATEITTKSTMAKPLSGLDSPALTQEERMDKHTEGHSARDVIQPSVSDKANNMETFKIHVGGPEISQHSPSCLHQKDETKSQFQEHIQLAVDIKKEESEESQIGTTSAVKSISFSHIQPTAQLMVPDTQHDKSSGKRIKKKRQKGPQVESSNVPESISLKDEHQNLKSPESAPLPSADASVESESHGVPESDTATESWEEEKDDIKESQDNMNKEGTASLTAKVRKREIFLNVHIDLFKINIIKKQLLKLVFRYVYIQHVFHMLFCFIVYIFMFLFPQSSLKRQECLEHDQRIVALVSMVRHMEVRLKQQQQQSVGRSLIALDDIIRQTEVKQ